MVTLIIAVYGAILSTISVVLRYLEQRVRLNVSFSRVLYPFKGMAKDVYQFTCVNSGKRSVALTGYGALLPGDNKLIAEWEPESPCSLPQILRDGDFCTLFVEYKRFVEILRQEGYTGKLNIRPFFSDALGNKYFAEKSIVTID
ncbi:MAG: hypothetical protein HXS49_04995 [Theionarchaea archaeon]|nr:hypothetical protein [Theionarchaea archaeon]